MNKLIGGSGIDVANSIQQTIDHGYIVAGYSGSSASGDVTGTTHGSNDFWVVKLDSVGTIVWNKLLGGAGSDQANSVRQTKDSGYIVAGFSTSSATGDVTGTNHGASTNDYWIVKLDGAGNIVWNKLIGGAGDEFANGIQQKTDLCYIVGGHSTSSSNGDVITANHGSSDYWIVKLDAVGNIVWNKLLGGINADQANSIQQTADLGYIIAGGSASSFSGDVSSPNHGGSDYWMLKLDASGNIVWNKLLGGAGSEIAYFARQTFDGSYIVAGYSTSSMTGDVLKTNHGNGDCWIVKLDALGNIQ